MAEQKKTPWGPVLAPVNFANLSAYMEKNVPGFVGPFKEVGQFGLGCVHGWPGRLQSRLI